MVELRLPVDRELVTWMPRVRTGTYRDGLKTGWILQDPKVQPRLVHSSSIVCLEFDCLHVVALFHDYSRHLVMSKHLSLLEEGISCLLHTTTITSIIPIPTISHLHPSVISIHQSITQSILSCNPNAPFLLCGLAVHVLCAQCGPHMLHHSNAQE